MVNLGIKTKLPFPMNSPMLWSIRLFQFTAKLLSKCRKTSKVMRLRFCQRSPSKKIPGVANTSTLWPTPLKIISCFLWRSSLMHVTDANGAQVRVPRSAISRVFTCRSDQPSTGGTWISWRMKSWKSWSSNLFDNFHHCVSKGTRIGFPEAERRRMVVPKFRLANNTASEAVSRANIYREISSSVLTCSKCPWYI